MDLATHRDSVRVLKQHKQLHRSGHSLQATAIGKYVWSTMLLAVHPTGSAKVHGLSRPHVFPACQEVCSWLSGAQPLTGLRSQLRRDVVTEEDESEEEAWL